MLVTEAAAAQERQKHHAGKAGGADDVKIWIKLLLQIVGDVRTPARFKAHNFLFKVLFKLGI